MDYYHLYVILDIYSRYAVGWMVATRESAVLAEKLIAATCAKQGIARGQLSLHADRGSSMTSKPVALLLADLGVTQSHSRPHVSNDNPYSEAQFKTLKYRPAFPARFPAIEAARAHCQEFFGWYNNDHRSPGVLSLSHDVAPVARRRRFATCLSHCGARYRRCSEAQSVKTRNVRNSLVGDDEYLIITPSARIGRTSHLRRSHPQRTAPTAASACTPPPTSTTATPSPSRPPAPGPGRRLPHPPRALRRQATRPAKNARHILDQPAPKERGHNSVRLA